MTNLTEEQMAEANQHVQESVRVAQTVVVYLESLGVDLRLGVSAMGIAFGSGAADLGMPLAMALDMVRATYNHARTEHNVH